MSPVFKIGKCRIHKSMVDFVEEWVNYDSTKKNTDDDLLDATEIALSAAGVLLPTSITLEDEDSGPKTLDEEAWAHITEKLNKNNSKFDIELGDMA